MNTEKMNGLVNRVKNCMRFKTFSAQEMKKRNLRNRILEIQETLAYLMTLRENVRNNHWFDAILKYSYHKEDRLLRKYIRLYGEFPVGVAEEIFH
jgi:hypothetical protein